MSSKSIPPELIHSILDKCPSSELVRLVKELCISNQSIHNLPKQSSTSSRNISSLKKSEEGLMKFLLDPSLKIHRKLIVRKWSRKTFDRFAEFLISRLTELGLPALSTHTKSINFQAVNIHKSSALLEVLLICGHSLLELDLGNGANSKFTNDELFLIAKQCPNLAELKLCSFMTKFEQEGFKHYDNRGIVEVITTCPRMELLDVSCHQRRQASNCPRINAAGITTLLLKQNFSPNRKLVIDIRNSPILLNRILALETAGKISLNRSSTSHADPNRNQTSQLLTVSWDSISSGENRLNLNHTASTKCFINFIVFKRKLT